MCSWFLSTVCEIRKIVFFDIKQVLLKYISPGVDINKLQTIEIKNKY